MFLLVSVRHVGAHPGGQQHGVSIQISINLGKTFPTDISYTGYSSGLNLGKELGIFTSFHFPDSGLIYWTVLIFILIYFEWCDTQNQQYIKHETQCFITRWNTEKRVGNTTRSGVFLTNFEEFHLAMKYCFECLILLVKENDSRRRN